MQVVIAKMVKVMKSDDVNVSTPVNPNHQMAPLYIRTSPSLRSSSEYITGSGSESSPVFLDG